MDRLEHQPPVLAGHIKNALGPQDVGPLGLQHLVEPGREAVGVQRLAAGQRNPANAGRLDVVIVVVAVMVVVMPMMIVPMHVMIMVAVLVMHVSRLAVRRIEEVRLDLLDARQVEGAAAQDLRQGHIGPFGAMDRRQRVQPPDQAFHLGQLRRGHQVGLVEDDLVGKGHLLDGLARVGKAQRQVLGVDHGGHAVELGPGANVLVDEEGLRHRARVGQAGGLHDDRVEAALALHQARDNPDQVAAHRAADAAVVHLEDFLVGADDQVVVDADLAELVDDHGVALAVVLR